MGSMITRFMSAQRTTALRALAAVLVAAFMAALIAALAIAPAASASEGCPNETIRTNQANYLGLKQPGELLPDCRAYELVTPADLNGNGIEYVLGMNPDGETLAYRSIAAFGEAESAITGLERGTRTSDGWQTSALDPATLGRPGEAYDEPYALAFSTDLSEVVFGSPYPFSEQDTGSYKNASESGSPDIYLRQADGTMTWVSHGETLPDPSEITRAFGGASADLKRIFFETRRSETKAVVEATKQEHAAEATKLEEEARELEEEAKKLEEEGNSFSAERKRAEAEKAREEADGELGRHDIYEWHEGRLSLVNLDAEGKLMPGGADVGRTLGTCGCYNAEESYGGGLNKQGHAGDRTAVSGDGTTVFFTAPVEPVAGKMLPAQLYVRVDGERTLEASRCRAAACEVEGKREGAPHGADFLIASPDGSTVLFYSPDQLSEGAPAGGGIYRYEVASEALTFLTPIEVGELRRNHSPSEVGTGSHTAGLLAASEDLSYLYLCEGGGHVAVFHEGKLSPVATIVCNASGETSAQYTQPEASRYIENVPAGLPQGLGISEPRDTPASGYVFSTTAGPQDVADGEAEITEGEAGLKKDEEECKEGKPTWNPSYYCEGGQGRAFTEREVKSGKRSVEEGKEFSSYENEGHAEVYLYTAATKTLSCLSCRPSGEPAKANAYPDADSEVPSQIGVPANAGAEVQNLAEDGGTAFFVSEDALVPVDVNESLDVYEWERAGVGSCTTKTASATALYSPASGGCVALISSGAKDTSAAIEGMSASGSDLFIASYQSLAPQDSGSELVIYDARVDGGFPPAAGEVGSAGPCEGVEACRSPLSEPPAEALGASSALFGPGNLTPPPSEGKSVGPKTKKLTRAQKLKAALKRCAHAPKRRRRECRGKARERFGAGHSHAHAGRRRRTHTTSANRGGGR